MPGGKPGPALDARALVRQVETQYMGKTSRARSRMRVVSDWDRTLVMDMWGEGRDKFLAVIRLPKKERGIATLKIEDDVWNYLPKIDRLMKVPSSLMGDNWMGSHLTNDDLVKENKVEELFDLSVEAVEGSSVTILAAPKPDAAVVWGRILYRIDLDKRVPTKLDYFDEDGEMVRSITFDRLERVAGKWIPMRMVVLPVEEPDEYTEIVYEKLELDVPLKKGLFSLRSLRRRR